MTRRALIGVVAVMNLVVAIIFEAIRPHHLTYDGLWNARTAFWAGLLLFDNLIVVWWYATLTARAVRTSETQAELSRQQLALSRESEEEKRKPCVVIDWKFVPSLRPEAPPGHTYVARNVGAGLALNVVFVEDLNAQQLDTNHIGALQAGGEAQLPQTLVNSLNEETPITRKRRLLIAEPVGGNAWIVSENLKETSGRISHRIRSKALQPEQIRQIHRDTADEYIHRNWAQIRRELDEMLQELQRNEP